MSTTRKIAAIIATSISLFVAAPAMAADRPDRTVRINQERFDKLAPEQQQRVLEIKSRLEVLMATDRSTLQPAERAGLRNEWKELKSEMKQQNASGEVIYISTGALIIIILLLIIIL